MQHYHGLDLKNLFLRLVFFAALVPVAGGGFLLLPDFAKAASSMGLKGKLVKPGQLLIGGQAVKCGTTPALLTDHFPDFGAARRGLIILNLSKQKHLPLDARLLIYYHECAHQYVGGSELAADCWAVQKVRRDGLMDKKGLKNACLFIESLPANRSHPPGKMRCRQMIRCYNNTFLRSADKRGWPHTLTRRGFSSPGARQPILRMGKRR